MGFSIALKNLSKLQYLTVTAVGCGSVRLIPSALRHFKSKPLNNDDYQNFQSRHKFDIPDCSESVKEEFIVTSRGLVAIKKDKRFEMRQDFENLYLIFELPAGFGKEDVKLSMEADRLIVKGEVDNESEKYGFISKMNIPFSRYHQEKIKAHFNNGVLEMVFPKLNHTLEMKDFKNMEYEECVCERILQNRKFMFEPFKKADPEGELVVEKSKSGSGIDVREDAEAAYLTIEVPGFGKDDIKITFKGNFLAIQGVGPEGDLSLSGGMEIPPDTNPDTIRAHMNNGILKIIVLKPKDGNATTSSDDVKHITVC